MWPTRAERQAGFSLLEILVAFTILATVITVLLQIFAGGLRNLRVGDEYMTAVTIAEARLAEIGRAVPVVPGDIDGEFGRYHWHAAILPYAAQALPEDSEVALYEVAVTVRWEEGRRERSLTLNSLRPNLSEKAAP